MNIYSNNPAQFPGLDLLPMTVTGGFWRAGEDRNELPDRDYFVEKCRGNGPLAINVEHWKTDIRKVSHAESDASIGKLMTLSMWALKAFPDRVIGHYAIDVLRDYWTPQKSRLLHPLQWHAWNRANGYLKRSRGPRGHVAKGVPDLSHVVMPSLYTFYEDRDGWVKYAEANIAQARTLQKPVIPFIWPRYHGSTPRAYRTVEGDFWRVQLETLARLNVEGVCIWDGAQYFHQKHGAPLWTGDEDWIVATREALE